MRTEERKPSILRADGSWKPSPNVARGAAKVIRKMGEHTGRQRQMSRLVKFTEMPQDKLALEIDKLSTKDKREMMRAAAAINRVVRKIQTTGTLEAHADTVRGEPGPV